MALNFINYTTLTHYWQLMRFDKPIGLFLLLWPTLLALCFASEGIPPFKISLIFILGTICMRAAGCVINDIADRNFDRYVKRTAKRPLTTGALSVRQALGCLAILLSLALMLVSQTNLKTVMLSFGALGVATLYPLMKRVLAMPQLVLGVAFAWAVPMAFTAVNQVVPTGAWILFSATVMLTFAYDTLYAIVDKSDDIKLGIHSTAIFFRSYAVFFAGLFHGLALALFAYAGFYYHLKNYYFIGLSIALILVARQYLSIRILEPQTAFNAFLNNQWIGFFLFIGALLEFTLR